jgi:tetratricopeptide (TPR) repeat protein
MKAPSAPRFPFLRIPYFTASVRRAGLLQKLPSWSRAIVAIVMLATLAAAPGCIPLSPQATLVLEALNLMTPALQTLMNNMKSVDEPNRKKLAELEAKKDWDGMIAFAQQNLKVDAMNADWWTVLGYAYTQQARYEDAAAAFQRVVEYSPDEIDGYNLLAEAYRVQGKPAEAIRTLDRALRVNQDSPTTYFLIGECFNDLKEPDRAVEYYQLALRRDSQMTDAWFGLGVAYARLGRTSEFDQVEQGLRKLSPQRADQLAQLRPRTFGSGSASSRPQ